MSPTTGPYSNPGGTGAASDPVAPPHVAVSTDARHRAAQVIARYDWEHGVSANPEPGVHTYGEVDALLANPEVLRALAVAPACPVDVAARLRAVAKILADAGPYLGSTRDIETLKRLADCIEAEPDDAESQAIARALTGEGTP